MSGYGWNLGYGNSNNFNSNPIPIPCQKCNRVLIGTEAFMSHYEKHIIAETFTLGPVREMPPYQNIFPNNNLHVQHQANNFHVQHQASQNNLVLAPCRDPSYIPTTTTVPQARLIRSAYPAMQQQVQVQPPPPMQIERRGNENPLNVYARAPIPCQVNQPAADVIDLVDSDEESESTEGGSNELDLTLRLYKP